MKKNIRIAFVSVALVCLFGLFSKGFSQATFPACCVWTTDYENLTHKAPGIFFCITKGNSEANYCDICPSNNGNCYWIHIRNNFDSTCGDLCIDSVHITFTSSGKVAFCHPCTNWGSMHPGGYPISWSMYSLDLPTPGSYTPLDTPQYCIPYQSGVSLSHTVSFVPPNGSYKVCQLMHWMVALCGVSKIDITLYMTDPVRKTSITCTKSEVQQLVHSPDTGCPDWP